MVRLQKYLADAGVASRRAAEKLIVDGRVAVDGAIIRQLGTRVDERSAEVEVDGKVVRVRRKRHIALHKPMGFISSRKDPQDRETVMDLLPREWENLYPVGRLDADSEGLLLMTNDGDFCLRVSHPRYGVIKTYVAYVTGRVDRRALKRMEAGLVHDGEKLRAEKTRLVSANNSHSVVELDLREGKNREVRRLFEAQGMNVERLRRVKIGSVKLGELPPGKWRTLTDAEIKSLLD